MTGEGKVGYSVKRLSKTLDGLKYRQAPAATAQDILRAPGTRIRRTKENEAKPHDGPVARPADEK